MLDVGVSGKFLFLHWNNVHIFRWICQHQTNLSVYHWKIWKGGQFLLLTLPMFVFDVLGKLLIFCRALWQCRVILGSSLKAAFTRALMTAGTILIFFQKTMQGSFFSLRNILAVMKSLVDKGAKLSNNGMTKKWNQAIYCVIWWFKTRCQQIWPLFIKSNYAKIKLNVKKKLRSLRKI